MIDFHNHIIPKIDDGAKSFEMAKKMAQKAYSDNIDCIVNTVHLNHPTVKNSDFDTIIKRKNEFVDMLNEENINIKIISAAEVFFDTNLVELSHEPISTIKNKYMLIEFNPNFIPPIIDEVFFKLKCNGIYPIIAHPERYIEVQENVDLVDKWIKKEYLIQINCGSLIGYNGKKIQKTSNKLFQKNLVHLIGSDAHNDSNRNVCLAEAIKIIEKKFGSGTIDVLKSNSEKLINGYDLEEIKSKKNRRFWFF